MKAKGIEIKKFCHDLGLEPIYDGGEEKIYLTSSSVNRPGLQLYGFYKHFDSDRIQIIGKVEHSYLNQLDKDEKRIRVEQLFEHYFPCFIVAWNLEIDDIYLEMAKKYKRVLLRSKKETSKTMNKIINYLNAYLAPTISIHGVLVEVFGVGVLITGSSGVGKSETALELIKRGHILVSDDVVEIRKIGDDLIGNAPDMLKQYMEIRGIGIIDIRTLYGIGAVKESVLIEMNVNLEHWDSEKYYDRLGVEESYVQYLKQDVPQVVIPVTSGRNLAIIIEAAARNNRLKAMGINSAQEFCDRVMENNENKEKGL
ncbi:MAG TPA: HPr kinase/phosphorylase [Eubacteriaceae bacterium]|nr:HPr kinase/phosphorylase [Eubacteriaceae bacterium]